MPCLTRGPGARPKLRGCYSQVPPVAIVATLTRHPVEKREQKCAFEEAATKTAGSLARMVLSPASLASWTRRRTYNPKIAGSSPAGGVSILVTLSHVCHPRTRCLVGKARDKPQHTRPRCAHQVVQSARQASPLPARDYLCETA